MRQQETKYKALADWLREKIDTQELKEGQRLYSENELSEMFKLSRQTVRRAIGMLEEEGLVERSRGSGTYVGKRRNAGRPRYRNIALISTYVDSYIFPSTIQGIVRTLSDAGYVTQIAFTNNRVSDERKILESILEKDNVDGVIVEAAKSALPNPNLDYYRELQSRGVALLFFNCKYPELDAPLVALDDYRVARDTAEYLLSLGHRRIAGIFKSDDGQGRLRYAGYVDALLRKGLPVDDRKILWIDTVNQKNLKNIKDLVLRRLVDCTAVFCYNDEVACSLLDILHQEKIRVPGQISIAGIDGAELSQKAEPQITTVPYPMEELGSRAAANLIALLEQPGFDADYLYRPELLVRDSVRRVGDPVPDP
ncbi:MAG: GntR family transcriptional regulator [Eubacteriales bacterium]|nr:GntR family transcriptional regulator [Eubacteriales bacterium]